VPTRKPVKATGGKMRVAYFTTTKLMPQITAIMNNRRSVTPNAGCGCESAMVGGWVTVSVIDES